MVKGSALKYLKCPICDGDFLESGNSVLCKKGHCYDISKRGYINFSQNRKEKVYGKNLFNSRFIICWLCLTLVLYFLTAEL